MRMRFTILTGRINLIIESFILSSVFCAHLFRQTYPLVLRLVMVKLNEEKAVDRTLINVRAQRTRVAVAKVVVDSETILSRTCQQRTRSLSNNIILGRRPMREYLFACYFIAKCDYAHVLLRQRVWQAFRANAAIEFKLKKRMTLYLANSSQTAVTFKVGLSNRRRR